MSFRRLKAVAYEFDSEGKRRSCESLVCLPNNITSNRLLESTLCMQREGQLSGLHSSLSTSLNSPGHTVLDSLMFNMAVPLTGSLSFTETIPVTKVHTGNSYLSFLYHDEKVGFQPSLKKCTKILVTLHSIWMTQSHLGLTRSFKG